MSTRPPQQMTATSVLPSTGVLDRSGEPVGAVSSQ
ncbi:hypothetical protein QFZ29_002162 [Agromyces albus]|nr:hypothetical protein [Agromyces albus]